MYFKPPKLKVWGILFHPCTSFHYCFEVLSFTSMWVYLSIFLHKRCIAFLDNYNLNARKIPLLAVCISIEIVIVVFLIFINICFLVELSQFLDFILAWRFRITISTVNYIELCAPILNFMYSKITHSTYKDIIVSSRHGFISKNVLH